MEFNGIALQLAPFGTCVKTGKIRGSPRNTMSSYTANALNQYTQRTEPGYAGVRGSATNTATVTVNGNAALSAMFAIGIFMVNAVIASWNIQGTIEGFHDPKFKKWPFAFRACLIASVLLALASVLITGGA